MRIGRRGWGSFASQNHIEREKSICLKEIRRCRGGFDGGAPGAEHGGAVLTPWQFESLCRHVLSREYGIRIASIQTGHLRGPSGATQHQIDLYWRSSDGICEFLCFANAKFKKNKVELRDMMTLLGVQREIRAHKAMLITNTGFTEACQAMARENGVALLIVRPAADLDVAGLPALASVANAAERIEAGFVRRTSPAYRMGVVNKGWERTGHEGTEGGRHEGEGAARRRFGEGRTGPALL